MVLWRTFIHPFQPE